MRRVKIENPIVLGEHIAEKTVILDLNVTFNGGERINLELQVVNEENWPERSVYYACRNFAKLFKGGMYKSVKPVYQIGIVDFSLFKEEPVFYATYQLRDEKGKHVYTDKFNIGVLDLTKMHLVIIPPYQHTLVAVQSTLTALGSNCLNPLFRACPNWLCQSMVKPAAAYSRPIDRHRQLELISIKRIKAQH